MEPRGVETDGCACVFVCVCRRRLKAEYLKKRGDQALKEGNVRDAIDRRASESPDRSRRGPRSHTLGHGLTAVPCRALAAGTPRR